MSPLVILVPLWSLTAVLAFHVFVFAAAASWYTTNVSLAWSDRQRLERRNANRPWYVRYPRWLEARAAGVRRVLRRVVRR